MGPLLVLASLAAAQDLLVDTPVTVSASATYDHIVVLDGGVLTVDAGAPITLTATSVYVADGGLITATGTGYAGVDDSDGDGPAGGGAGGGGGGHVGSGEPDWVGSCDPGSPGGVGMVPPDPLILDMGSAGGGDGGPGSAGGGALTVIAHDIEVYGRIEADGADATPTGGAGGGGALALLADRLVCTGDLSAKGGQGEYNGPGGGGLVAQRYDTHGVPCTRVDVRGGEELECDGPDAGDGLSDVASWDYDGDGAAVDCDPRDAAVPGLEVCNGLDDDCNGLVDDGVDCGGCTAHHEGGVTYQHCTASPTDQAGAFEQCAQLDPDRYELLTLTNEDEWTAVRTFATEAWVGLQETTYHQYRWASGELTWFHPWVTASCGAGSQPDNTDGCIAMVDSLGVGCEGHLDDRTCTDAMPYVCEACNWRTFYVDADGDGIGDVTQPIEACRPEGLGAVSETPGDCDDLDATVHPGAPEVCDGVDNDCDGHIDPMGLLFADTDVDGFGDPATPLTAESCDDLPLVQVSRDDGDCNDGAFILRPDATELCDGIDNDCNGSVDDGDVCATCTHTRLDDADYQVCTTGVVMTTARGICQARAGDLASLATIEENQLLSSILAEGPVDRMWMGLQDVAGVWTWLDGTPYDLELWDDLEPSGDGTGGELWDATPGDRFGTWNDAGVGTVNGFLCEVPCEQQTLFPDGDGDGFGAGASVLACPGDGWVANDADCDDGDARVHPGAFDIPGDDLDQDCTGLLRCYIDEDGDGYGTDQFKLTAACDESGVTDVSGDCDDTDPAVHPTAPELIGDGIDQDCDQRDLCFVDDDGDGFGTGAVRPGSSDTCDQPGEATMSGDCLDTDPTVHPEADELTADGVDNDCDGFDACYDDVDGDGYGTATLVDGTPNVVSPCSDGGVAPFDGDCDPFNASISPGATEIVASGADENCDARELCFIDGDGDGSGDQTESTVDIACDDPGHTTVGGDCDDADDTRHPYAQEAAADGIDQDCDNADDYDADADGYVEDAYAGLVTRGVPGTGSLPAGECDDTNPTVNPGATDTWYDGIDQDCDGADDYDADVDGYVQDIHLGLPTTYVSGSGALPDGDCDDTVTSVNPGATDTWYDGIDQDCDGRDDYDADEDGYVPDAYTGLATTYVTGSGSLPDGDCDDTDSSINPAATDTWYDGIDQDCDGADDYDADGDGYASSDYTGDDCDDDDTAINPGEAEICDDGIDQNCDGTSDTCSFIGDIPVTDADAWFYGENAVDRVGQGDPGMANGGDLDGDGTDDLVVSAIFADDAGTNAGVVHVFFGPVSGAGVGVTTSDVEISGEAAGDLLGRSVVAAGDVDNDGFDDLFVSAQGEATNGTNTGAAYLVAGPLTAGSSGVGSLATTKFVGAAAGDLIADLAPAGDVDGDGNDDLLISAQFLDAGGTTDGGGAYLIYGPTTTASYDLASPRSSDARFIGEVDGDEAGSSLWGGEDLDGDGTPDIIVASRYYDNGSDTDSGAVYVVHGPVSGDVDLSAADARFVGENSSDELGYGAGVSTAGDLNGDGYQDLVAGARFNDRGGTKSGAGYVILGPITSGTLDTMSNADAIFVGEAASDQTGDSVSGPGDVDGDGVDDLLIGSGWYDSTASNGGAGYFILGPVTAGTGVVDLSNADGRFLPEGDNDRLRITGGGDLDADGYADILIATQNNSTNSATAGSQHGAAYLFYGKGL